MTAEFVGLLVLYLAVLLAIAPLLGRYIRIAMENGQSRLTAWGRPLERGIYRLAGIDPQAEMGWKRYAVAVLAFNILGIVVVYGLQRVQGMLPLNPAGMGAVTPDSALNTAISFVSNTNWQGYGGESTMSYLTQMLALTVQNFVSAATGIAVLFALIRGLARHCSATVGNFWADMVRCTLYVLLPLSFVLALALVSQGVIQNFSPYQDVQTVEALHYDQPRVDAQGQPVLDAKGQPVTDPAVTSTQTLAMGPVASQEAIKLLGTNGGGFFNANS
ncbi:MAG: potassium-transporting ATPase subunit KdpA, partial [Pseudomonas sp.]